MPAHKMKDGRWSVWLDLGSDPTSGRRLRKKIEAQTKREAEVKAHAISERHARGENVMDTPRTLTQLLDDWLLTIEHEDKTANSLKTYRGACRNHLTPHLGAVDVPKLRARMIQTLFNELIGQLAPSTIQLIKTVLVSALNLAVEQNEISSNPAEKIRIPTIKRTTGRLLSPEEVRGAGGLRRSPLRAGDSPGADGAAPLRAVGAALDGL